MSGLVNYSDSDDSDSDINVKPTSSTTTRAVGSTSTATASAPLAASTSTTKKPFQKLVDRANPGRILVSLPSAAASADDRPSQTADEQPPAKRARTEGGGRFSAFRSALPPPKKAVAAKPAASASSSLPFTFKTSAEAAFSRESVSTAGGEYDDIGEDDAGARPDRSGGLGGGLSLNLPPPKSQAAGGISTTNGSPKPPDEVKLKGKTLMFKPLSVARKPMKKTGVKANGGGGTAKPATDAPKTANASPAGAPVAAMPRAEEGPAEPPKKKKKVSLFSLGEDAAGPEPEVEPQTSTGSRDYEPLFEESGSYLDAGPESAVTSDYAAYQAPEDGQGGFVPAAAAGTGGESLHSIADDLNLSAAARRELFGRGGTAAAQQAMASKVVNFNLDREYQNNEDMRASGQLNQPARAVKGIAPGKHNLRQLVNAVASQRDALEESFAKNRSNQRDAAGRYGWR